MFNEETCIQCGECLSECPFLELSEEKAQDEIVLMIETRHSDEILNNCVSCGQCNSLCPTESNPFDLIREIKLINNSKEGVPGMFLNSEEIPSNMFKIALDLQTEEEKSTVKGYSNPSKSTEMFYVGCSIPYFFPDLLKTKLFDNLPIIGGMKYCCGAYLMDHFGMDEAVIRGKKLLSEFKELGLEKLITLCSGCEMMIGTIYPKIIEGFDIETQGLTDYFLERHHKGELEVKNSIDKRITFHDPCLWREIDSKVYDPPRELLEILGAEIVEMKHSRENSNCCGNPPSPNLKPPVSMKINAERVAEAEEIKADVIAVNCTGCLGLSRNSSEKGIDTYHIVELVQMAIGEKPVHRINETFNNIDRTMMEKIKENPQSLMTRYIARSGKFLSLMD